MWGSILTIALAAIPSANAITLHKRDEPAVLGLPIARSQRSSLQKRDSNTASTDLYNVGNMYYMVNITVGTPPQNLSLSLDIGSSDIWVNVPNSTYCSTDDDVCSSTGLFKSSDSSTFKLLDYDLNATYVSGFLAAGPYATDTLKIGGATLKDMEFAVADQSQNPHGILGIGYALGTYAANGLGKEYDNLPIALVKSGAINSAAYSLWLNKFDGTGNLLFGGVNKARYQGELRTVPVLKTYGAYLSLDIALTEISVKSSGGTSTYTESLPLAVTLDNGSATIVLPEDILKPIFKEIGATWDSDLGAAYISCDKNATGQTMTFSFSGAKVEMPLGDLIFETPRYSNFPDGSCFFGFSYGEPGVSLMGDPFLRGAYVVYDLENNEISLANTNYDGGDDDILEIGTGTTAVPGATAVPSPVTSATGDGTLTGPQSTITLSAESSGTGAATVTATATATGTNAGSASSTSSSGLASMPTKMPNLLPGIVGAGLLLAL